MSVCVHAVVQIGADLRLHKARAQVCVHVGTRLLAWSCNHPWKELIWGMSCHWLWKDTARERGRGRWPLWAPSPLCYF